MSLEGIFQINDWKETVNKDFGELGKLSTAVVCQTYQGDIVGDSEVRYELSYTPEGDAAFVGFEVINATIAEQQSRIILKHEGYFKDGIAKADCIVVSATPNISLVGVQGHYESAENGQAEYKIG